MEITTHVKHYKLGSERKISPCFISYVKSFLKTDEIRVKVEGRTLQKKKRIRERKPRELEAIKVWYMHV